MANGKATNSIPIASLIATFGLLFSIGVVMPAATATTVNQDNSTTATPGLNGSNQSSVLSNDTQLAGNQTAPVPSVSAEEQRSALVRSFIDNVTSGNIKVVMVTQSNQPDVPSQQEMRDADVLGLAEFPGDRASMRVMRPENETTSLGGTADQVSSLYAGGRITFMFENLQIQPPDDIDMMLISKSGDQLRFPLAVDNTGLDNEFVVPEELTGGGHYLVIVAMHWPDLQQDVVMGIDGRAVATQQQ
jgi:hypothetical protein